VTREELIARTRQLIEEGRRLLESPSLGALQLWLQLSDDLLRAAWGVMDRFHMAWLTVGRPARAVRGRPMTPDEEAAYVREVVVAKNAVLEGSLDAVLRGLPFVGEQGGVGPGGLPAADAPAGEAGTRPGSLAEVNRALTEARRQAQAHRDHPGPRAPRPEKLQR
jgi:hypothetical protein